MENLIFGQELMKVASCGGVTVEQLKAYVEKQKSPDK